MIKFKQLHMIYKIKIYYKLMIIMIKIMNLIQNMLQYIIMITLLKIILNKLILKIRGTFDLEVIPVNQIKVNNLSFKR